MCLVNFDGWTNVRDRSMSTERVGGVRMCLLCVCTGMAGEISPAGSREGAYVILILRDAQRWMYVGEYGFAWVSYASK